MDLKLRIAAWLTAGRMGFPVFLLAGNRAILGDMAAIEALYGRTALAGYPTRHLQ